MRGISDTGYGITIDLGDLVHGTIDKYAEMGAPEQEVAQSRQHADALLESMKRTARLARADGIAEPTRRRLIPERICATFGASL